MPFGSTQRLRSIQIPSHGSRLAESLLAHAVDVPPKAYRIQRVSELPSPLQRVVRVLSNEVGAWIAHSTLHSTSLCTAQIEFDLARERDRPVLRIREYNDQGRVIHSNLWVNFAEGEWSVLG
jgi:hypothetical protein